MICDGVGKKGEMVRLRWKYDDCILTLIACSSTMNRRISLSFAIHYPMTVE